MAVDADSTKPLLFNEALELLSSTLTFNLLSAKQKRKKLSNSNSSSGKMQPQSDKERRLFWQKIKVLDDLGCRQEDIFLDFLKQQPGNALELQHKMNIRLVAVQQFPVKNKNLKNLLVFDGRFVPPSLLHIGQEEKKEKEKKEEKEKEKEKNMQQLLSSPPLKKLKKNNDAIASPALLVCWLFDHHKKLVGQFDSVKKLPLLYQKLNYYKSKHLIQPLKHLLSSCTAAAATATTVAAAGVTTMTTATTTTRNVDNDDDDDDNNDDDRIFQNLTTFEEIKFALLQHLATANKLYKNVVVSLCVSLGNRPWRIPLVEWKSLETESLPFEMCRLDALPGPNYKLVFRFHTLPKFPKENVAFNSVLPPTSFACPKMKSYNRSSAVSVFSTGLNQAIRLGCILQRDFKNASHQLALLAGAMHFDFDDAGQIRCATYTDVYTKQFFEFKGCNRIAGLQMDTAMYNDSQWQQLFAFLWSRHEKLQQDKLAHLKPVLEACEKMCPANCTLWNPWKSCLLSLQRCAKRLTVVVFSPNDSVLHAIKIQFAHFIHLKKAKYLGPKKVNLKLTQKNDLIALCTPEIMLVNIGEYYKDCTEQDLFPAVAKTTPPPFIQPNITNLKHHPKMTMLNYYEGADGNMYHASQENATTYCRVRGQRLSHALGHLWCSLVGQLESQFEFDLASLPFTPFSGLAFQLVWYKYCRAAGPMHHGLEKMKPFYNDLIRQHCRGGYSFSCKDRVDCGKPLRQKQKQQQQQQQQQQPQHFDCKQKQNDARTLLELDIVSSYGFAASSMQAPTGFCVGYIYNVDKKN
ncbi:MAG: hypothetical protein ACOVKJ_07835, partial [Flavobacterium sp.]